MDGLVFRQRKEKNQHEAYTTTVHPSVYQYTLLSMGARALGELLILFSY